MQRIASWQKPRNGKLSFEGLTSWFYGSSDGWCILCEAPLEEQFSTNERVEWGPTIEGYHILFSSWEK